MHDNYVKTKDKLEEIICNVVKSKIGKKSLLARLCDSEKYHTTPGDIADKTGSRRGETTYQRCFLYCDKPFILNPQKYEIKFIDGELPVVFGKKSRRKSIDLVGTLDKKPFICELKYANPDSSSKSNSPKYALLELATYHYQILQNKESLLKYKIKHQNKNLPENFWIDICNTANLIVLGNEKYWARWQHGTGVIDGEFINMIKACFYDKFIRIFFCVAAEYKPEKTKENRYRGVLEHQNIFEQPLK